MHKLHMALITVKLITFCTVLVQPCPLISIPAVFFWCWIIYSRLLRNIYDSRDASLLIYYSELIVRYEHEFNPKLVLKFWLLGAEPLNSTKISQHLKYQVERGPQGSSSWAWAQPLLAKTRGVGVGGCFLVFNYFNFCIVTTVACSCFLHSILLLVAQK